MIGVIIFGEKGSGKDTVAELIEKYSNMNVYFFNIGDLCREMSCIFLATDIWSNKKREFYVDVANKLKEYHKDFLNFYVEGKVLNKFKCDKLQNINEDNLIIITGGRTEEDYNFWINKGFYVIGIQCDDKIRQSRLKNRDGYEQLGEDTLERNTKKIIKKSNYIISNNGTKEDLEKEIKCLVSKLNI